MLAVISCVEPPQHTAEPTTHQPQTNARYDYVGSQLCADCHSAEYAAWRKSDHFFAMQKVSPALAKSRAAATLTDGYQFGAVDGKLLLQQQGEPAKAWPVPYLFGHVPLQQYLVDTGGGRLQAFVQAWDSAAGKHFKLYPEVLDSDDVLHWSKPGQNWNYMCADCHSTGLRKNYDSATNQYHTEYAEISVGCEGCHGAGSAHVAWAQQAEQPGADVSGLEIVGLGSQAEQINTCAQCHSRRGQLAEGFSPREQFLDHYSPALLQADLYHPDGQIMDEVYVYGSFLQSKMFQAGVTCSNCHNAHTGQLQFAGNGTCTQCHNAAGRPDFSTLRAADYDHPSHHKHGPNSEGGKCVNCHMPAKTYMGIDARRDHSFHIPHPADSAALGIPDACSTCHEDRGSAWLVAEFKELFGAEPPGTESFARLFIAGREGDPGAAEALSELAQDPLRVGIVRATALSILAEFDQHVSAAAIGAGLRDGDPLLRLGAIQGTRRWPAEQRWQALRPLRSDRLLAVRVAVVQALLDVLPALAPALVDELRPALDEYRQTLNLTADRAEGQTNLAGLQQALGHLEQAEMALQQALSLNPQWLPAYVNLADIYRQTGRDRQAGKLLDTALAINDDLPDILLAKALWLVRQQQRQAALPLLQRAHELLPSNSQYLYVYAVALHSTQQSPLALVLLEAQIQSGKADQQLTNLAMSIARDSGDMAAVSRLLTASDGN